MQRKVLSTLGLILSVAMLAVACGGGHEHDDEPTPRPAADSHPDNSVSQHHGTKGHFNSDIGRASRARGPLFIGSVDTAGFMSRKWHR